MNTSYKYIFPETLEQTPAPFSTNEVRDFMLSQAQTMPFFDKYRVFNAYLFDAVDHNESFIFWMSRKVEEFLIFTICHFFPSLVGRYYPMDLLIVESVSFPLPEIVLDGTSSLVEAALSILSYAYNVEEELDVTTFFSFQKGWSVTISILLLALTMLSAMHLLFINTRTSQLNKSAVAHRLRAAVRNIKVWW